MIIETETPPRLHPILTPFLRSCSGFINTKRPYIGPSNIVSMCPREYALQIKHKESRLWALETLFAFEEGFVAEKLIHNILHKANIKVLTDQMTLNVGLLGYTSPRGRSDFLIKFPSDDTIIRALTSIKNDVVLLEVKKMNPVRFATFRRRGKQAEAAAEFQLLTYLKALANTDKYPTPDYGLIVGVKFNPLELFDDTVSFSEGALAEYDGRIALMEKVKKECGNFVPERFYTRGSFYCKSCTMRHRCWDPGEKNLNVNSLDGSKRKELEEAFAEYALVDARGTALKKRRDELRHLFDKALEQEDAESLILSNRFGSFEAISSLSETQRPLTKELRENYPTVWEDVAPIEFGSRLRVKYSLAPQFLEQYDTETSHQLVSAASESRDDEEGKEEEWGG